MATWEEIQQKTVYAKLKPPDKHFSLRKSIDEEMAVLLQDVEAIENTSVTFKNRQLVTKHRTSKLKSKKEYGKITGGRDGFEFTPFTWPKLLLAVRAGDEFNVRALIENRGFNPNDSDELARCVDAAAKRGDERIARALIFIGADPAKCYPDVPRTSWTPLNVAAEAGQTHLVKALLDLGADANAMPPALHVACFQGDLESVKTIVRWMEKDARDEKWMSLKDDNGQTCVHRAARNGHFPVLEFLCVGRGADIDARDEKNRTPLLLAVEAGSLATVQWMVHHGAAANSACDNQGDNGLLMAFFACTRRPKKGRLMTSRFAGNDGDKEGNEDQRGDDGNSNFDGIEEQRRNEANVEYMEIVTFLLPLATKQEQIIQNKLGETILMVAAKYGMESLVNVALSTVAAKDGDLINLMTLRGENALHHACRAQSVRIIWLLRTYQPPINQLLISNDGMTALDIATSTGNPDVMDAMLSPIPLQPSPVGTVKARRWEQDGKDGTNGLNREMLLIHEGKEKMQQALYAAARFGKVNLIHRLINQFKCKVNSIDKNGNTPLHIAVLNRKRKAAEMLKRRGVPLHVKNNLGYTVIEMARHLKDRGKMLDMLQRPFV